MEWVQNANRGGFLGAAAACRGAFRREVENLVRATADQVETVECRGRLGALPDEALQELVGESRGFVETETGFRMRRIQSRVTLNILEESIQQNLHSAVRTAGSSRAGPQVHVSAETRVS